MFDKIYKELKKTFGSEVEDEKQIFLNTEVYEIHTIRITLNNERKTNFFKNKYEHDYLIMLKSLKTYDLLNKHVNCNLFYNISSLFYQYTDDYNMDYKRKRADLANTVFLPYTKDDVNEIKTINLYEYNLIDKEQIYLFAYEYELIKCEFYEYIAKNKKKYSIILKNSNLYYIIELLKDDFKEKHKTNISLENFLFKNNDTIETNKNLVVVESSIISKFRYYLSETYFKNIRELDVEKTFYEFKGASEGVIVNMDCELYVILKKKRDHKQIVTEILKEQHPAFLLKCNTKNMKTENEKNKEYITLLEFEYKF